MSIRAIETQYNGYRFRSRLEARWAVYFDALGLEYIYEPEGYDMNKLGYYLPDYWLPLLNCFAEVKPKQFTRKEFARCKALGKPCLLLDTSYPMVKKGYFITATFTENNTFKSYASGDDYGRVLLDHSQSHKRLWFLFGESPNDYAIDDSPEIAAKSARFEHGEKPNVSSYSAV